jgi:predicted SAM-dependent methyltransferase
VPPIQETKPAPQSVAHAERILTEYLDEWESHPARLSDPQPNQPLIVRLGRQIVPRRFQFRSRLLATDLLVARERRRAARLASRRPLLLHPGCQKVRKEGWINIDLAGFPVDLAWNLLRPLPFPASVADVVFHEHLLEHFSLRDGLNLSRDWFRVLRPSGVLRIGVPDAGSYAHSYVEDPDGFLSKIRPNRPTPLLALQELFYWQNHRTMYDFETLRLLLMAAGFERVEQKSFGESEITPSPDSAHRELETLYVEAYK